MNEALSPTQIVILGGSGDLSRRKLLPALLDLFVKGRLPQQFHIIGQAKTSRSNEEYRAFVRDVLSNHEHRHNIKEINTFCEHVSYVTGSFDAPATYQSLQTSLMSYQEEIGMCSNRLFYLAVPPEYYEQIFTELHNHNMNEPCDTMHGWTRVLVEKPFGSDYQSARALDETLSSLFKEEQIFRIDHYLAKEAVQNILSFRFANPLIESSWNNQNIASIHIEMKETIDVGERGDFYEAVGALRDVGQNHLLQVLALLTMSQPSSFDAEHIRRERAYILNSLKPYSRTTEREVVRAQYDGFRDTAGVDSESETETYFEVTTELSNNDWRGVPITISAGKGLDEAVVRATVCFKPVDDGLFTADNYHVTPNKIILTLNPKLDIALILNNKKPGYDYRVEPDRLDFDCRSEDGAITNSYEKVLLDCICGDQTLFTSTEEVLAAWKYVSSILEAWHKVPMQTYTKGSSGPAALDTSN